MRRGGCRRSRGRVAYRPGIHGGQYLVELLLAVQPGLGREVPEGVCNLRVRRGNAAGSHVLPQLSGKLRHLLAAQARQDLCVDVDTLVRRAGPVSGRRGRRGRRGRGAGLCARRHKPGAGHRALDSLDLPELLQVVHLDGAVAQHDRVGHGQFALVSSHAAGVLDELPAAFLEQVADRLGVVLVGGVERLVDAKRLVEPVLRERLHLGFDLVRCNTDCRLCTARCEVRSATIICGGSAPAAQATTHCTAKQTAGNKRLLVAADSLRVEHGLRAHSGPPRLVCKLLQRFASTFDQELLACSSRSARRHPSNTRQVVQRLNSSSVQRPNTGAKRTPRRHAANTRQRVNCAIRQPQRYCRGQICAAASLALVLEDVAEP